MFLIVIVGRNFVLMEVKSNLLLLERKELPFSKLSCGEGEGLHVFTAFFCCFPWTFRYDSGASLQNERLTVESNRLRFNLTQLEAS